VIKNKKKQEISTQDSSVIQEGEEKDGLMFEDGMN
jgi:hypothetical protein